MKGRVKSALEYTRAGLLVFASTFCCGDPAVEYAIHFPIVIMLAEE